MHEQPESDTRDANGAMVSAGELTTRYVCGGVLGMVVALLLIFFCQIASAGICVAVVVIATLAGGFFAARYGDRFWEGLVNLLFAPWWR